MPDARESLSQTTKSILESEEAAKKRAALRAMYREVLENRLGKPLEEWYKLLAAHDPQKTKSHFQLAKYLQDEFGIDMADATTVVNYYLDPAHAP